MHVENRGSILSLGIPVTPNRIPDLVVRATNLLYHIGLDWNNILNSWFLVLLFLYWCYSWASIFHWIFFQSSPFFTAELLAFTFTPLARNRVNNLLFPSKQHAHNLRHNNQAHRHWRRVSITMRKPWSLDRRISEQRYPRGRRSRKSSHQDKR